MAFRHHCLNAGPSGSLKCPGGDGKPGKGPARCPGCKGQLVVKEGTYAVVPWRGDGRYSEADAMYWFQRETAAGARADAMNRQQDDLVRKGIEARHPRGYVVRFIPD